MRKESSHHALVVDDDPLIHEQAALVLSALGYQVRCARTAADALTLCGEAMPGLLVTAVMLPDAVGLELASGLRALSAEMAIIYLSARSDPVRLTGTLHAGSGTLQKPFCPAQLAGEVARLVAELPAPCAITESQ